ncbi:MAG: zinc-binding dehydrogenase [Promethearchaeota archaeon]
MFEDIKKIIVKDDYPEPTSGPDDVIVKVHYCGICGSDLTNFKYKMYQVPLVMGHEFSGEIVKIGENIIDFKIGDRVCGINVSLDLAGGGQLDGLGIFRDGGFAEYVKVPKKYLFKIPDNVSIKEAALIESFANATRGAKLSNIGENQNIMILGGGNIGLCFMNYLLAEKNPNYMVVIEPHSFLREKAKEMGATDAIPPNKIKIKKFLKEYGPPTFIFDCAGFESTINMAIDLIKKGGTIILVGVHKGTVSLPMFLLNSKEACLRGILGHDVEDIHASINFFAKRKVDVNKLISEIIPLDDIQRGFEKYLEPGEREFIKILVKL